MTDPVKVIVLHGDYRYIKESCKSLGIKSNIEGIPTKGNWWRAKPYMLTLNRREDLNLLILSGYIIKISSQEIRNCKLRDFKIKEIFTCTRII